MPLSPIVVLPNFLISEFGPLHQWRFTETSVLSPTDEYLGVTGDPLIDEEPEAWVSGPVFPDTLTRHVKHLDSNKRESSYLQLKMVRQILLPRSSYKDFSRADLLQIRTPSTAV